MSLKDLRSGGTWFAFEWWIRFEKKEVGRPSWLWWGEGKPLGRKIQVSSGGQWRGQWDSYKRKDRKICPGWTEEGQEGQAKDWVSSPKLLKVPWVQNKGMEWVLEIRPSRVTYRKKSLEKLKVEAVENSGYRVKVWRKKYYASKYNFWLTFVLLSNSWHWLFF